MSTLPVYPAGNARAALAVSLRDYYAGKAMQAAVTGAASWGPLEFLTDIDVEKVAEFANKMADAMLRARFST